MISQLDAFPPAIRSRTFGHTICQVKALTAFDHSDISTTMRYVHPTPAHSQQAARKSERSNVGQPLAMLEMRAGSLQKSIH